MSGPNDFTNQNIQDTYQKVLQISSSNEVTDGTGSLAPVLQVTSSNALLAVTASHALFAVSASHETTFELSSSHALNADSAISSSHTPNALTVMGTGTGNTVTVTQFDGTQFTRTINNVISSSYALTSSYSDTASYVETAQTASYVVSAISASHVPDAFTTATGTGTDTITLTQFDGDQTAITINNIVQATSASHALTSITASHALTSVTSSHALTAITASHALTSVTASHALFAVSASHETTFELSSSHALNADNAISSSHTPNALTTMGTGTGNTVTVTQFDGTQFTRTINNVTNAGSVPYTGLTGTVPTWNQNTTGNAATSDCSDQVKTKRCSSVGEQFLTFVKDDNAGAACEPVSTAPFLRVDCAKRALIVEGKIISKGSDITLMSGSISMSGDLLITGSISSSGAQSNLSFTTGSFNHIVTDGDTIEFRNPSNGNKIGHLKFDPTEGLQVGGPEATFGLVESADTFNAPIRADIVSAKQKVLTPKIVCPNDFTLDAGADIILSADGDQIKMDNGSTTRFIFNVDSTPELDITGNFILDGSGTVEIDAASNMLLDAGGDITLDAAGDQIYMKDNGATRFTFNVDSTPEIDIAGDLILDPTGGNIRVDGLLQSYSSATPAGPATPNYAIGGSQGYPSCIIIPYTEFKFARGGFDHVKGFLTIGGTEDVGFSYVIPQGYKIEAAIVIDGGFSRTVTIASTAGVGMCAPVDLGQITTTKCPKFDENAFQSYASSATVLHASVQAKLIGVDLNAAHFRVACQNKDVLMGAVLFMKQI